MFRTLVVSALLTFAVTGAPMACSPGTLADYVSLGSDGCTLGSRTISGFSPADLTFGSQEIDRTTVTITPLLGANSESLLFGLGAFAQNGLALESIFSFRVTTTSNHPQRITLQLIDATATVDGVTVGITEFSGVPGSLVVAQSATGGMPSDSLSFGPRKDLTVLQDFVIDAGLSGSASLGSAQLTFQAVPEPATYTSVVVALLAIPVLPRLRRR